METAPRYLQWDESSIEGLSKDGIHLLWTEVSATGHVLREIGLSNAGAIVHKFPSKTFPLGARGMFDGAVVETSQSDLAPSEFEAAWNGSHA